MSFIENNIKGILMGGGLISKPIKMDLDLNQNILFLFSVGIFYILLKGLLVMLTYNIMIPKITYNFNPNYDGKKFKKITFIESILLVILFSNLFNRI